MLIDLDYKEEAIILNALAFEIKCIKKRKMRPSEKIMTIMTRQEVLDKIATRAVEESL